MVEAYQRSGNQLFEIFEAFSQTIGMALALRHAQRRNRSVASGDLKFANAISQSSSTLNSVD